MTTKEPCKNCNDFLRQLAQCKRDVLTLQALVLDWQGGCEELEKRCKNLMDMIPTIDLITLLKDRLPAKASTYIELLRVIYFRDKSTEEHTDESTPPKKKLH